MENFETYLEDQFFKTYQGDREQFQDSVDAWMAQLDVQEVINYAQKWGDELLEK